MLQGQGIVGMLIGELAKLSGLSRDTLRFYEKRGLLRSKRLANGYRHYPAETIQWLGYLRSAQELGFTLAEMESDIKALSFSNTQPDPERIRSAFIAKVRVIEERIQGLEKLRSDLLRRISDAELSDCPLRMDR